MSEYFITKKHMFLAMRILKPDITYREFHAKWKEFVIARDKHYALKASLRVIDGGKK